MEATCRKRRQRLDSSPVIIPALNEAPHFARTLESVRKSSPHEIIVVDGGSVDYTLIVAKNYDAR